MHNKLTRKEQKIYNKILKQLLKGYTFSQYILDGLTTKQVYIAVNRVLPYMVYEGSIQITRDILDETRIFFNPSYSNNKASHFQVKSNEEKI